MNYFDKLLIVILKRLKTIKGLYFVKYLPYLITRKRNIHIKKKLENSLTIELHLKNISEYKLFMNMLNDDLWISITKLFTKNNIFIDIGANIGIYSLLLSKYSKRIYAFEPETENYSRLLKNVNNGNTQNISIIQKAAYSESGKKKLFINASDAGWHSLFLKTNVFQVVNTVTLDNFIKNKRLKNIGLIKIDVEGAELEVLKGLSNTLKKGPPILIEINRPRLIKSGFSPIDVFELLINNNYHAYVINKNGDLINLKKSEVVSIYNENVLFLPGTHTTSFNKILTPVRRQ